MRHLKMLGLALVAATALMAISGAGAASATRLCKAAEATCSAAKTYPAGTEIITSLERETSNLLRDTSSSNRNECTGSEVKSKTENETGATISGPITSLTFTGCTNTTNVTANGSIEISHISGTNNGTVTLKNTKVRLSIFGVFCIYGAGSGTDIGTLTGGAMATLDINAVVNLIEGGFFCPTTQVWEGKHTVTSPEPLFVTS
ncbi:MAG: hypothetical protein ACTHNP_09990 [Solirubrobacterales bacterium]